MTKTAMKIAERYNVHYKNWLWAYIEKAPHEKQEKLLIIVGLLESILANDCNLGYEGVAKLREQALDEFYANLAK